ncbi:hypothetical protein CUMW_280470 [Citrus unshiu]|uniref:Uncharacterized protein n=1 Tax=Citrus unshiu TaxID=55188 RepID=A0A2H5NAJ5_CITUN|nr:hypothetical protein CUMW_280470 [Citrus unshiu]
MHVRALQIQTRNTNRSKSRSGIRLLSGSGVSFSFFKLVSVRECYLHKTLINLDAVDLTSRYRCGHLCYLQEPHHGTLHRVSSESSQRYQPGLHGCLGFVQSRLSLPLHQPMAQDSPSITVCGNTKSMGSRVLQEATSGAAAVGSISH